MASLVRPWKTVYTDPATGERCRKTVPGAVKHSVQSKKWYGQYRNGVGKWVREPLSTDKRVAERILAEKVRDADLQRAGLASLASPVPDRKWEDVLHEHLADDPNITAKHTRAKRNQLRRLFQATKAVTVRQLTLESVRGQIDRLKAAGRAPRTVNLVSTYVKSFGRWLVKCGLARNPWRDLPTFAEEIDIRRRRGPFSDAEVAKILAVASAKGSRERKHRKLSFRIRPILYRLALNTGLRAAELASLTRRSFPADGGKVTILAAHAKNRKTATLPIPRHLQPDLRDYLSTLLPNQCLFPGTRWVKNASSYLRADMQAAGVQIEDAEGKVRDFHSLRHTYITNLVRAGASIKEAQVLARHSDPKITLRYYVHASEDSLRARVDLLPGG